MRSCAVSSSSRDSVSCLSKKQILHLTRYYNGCINSNICKHGSILKTTGTKKELLHNLLEELKISDEKEILKFGFIPKTSKIFYQVKYLIYKQTPIKRRNGWLDSDDLNTVMRQYQHRYSPDDFKFIGSHPSDFIKLYPYVPDVIKKSKKDHGIIFNTDPSDKPGEHWVACYINKDNKVEYFDSTGDRPRGNILKFIKTINPEYDYNKNNYQQKDGLCGVYCLYFLISKIRKQSLNIDISNADGVISREKEVFFIK